MSPQQKTEPRAAPLAINEFMGSLQRLFKIGIYYPSGHAILDKATERFMRYLKALAGDNPSVTLEDYENSLMLEGVKVDSTHPFVLEFKDMLSTLGVTAIIIDRDIALQELHIFVRKLLTYRSKVRSAKQFSQMEISEFPYSVQIVLKEFLVKKDSSISDEERGEAAENLDSFIQSLSQYGLSGEEVSQCRALLDALPARLTERNLDMSELPYASWDDVARLLAKAVRAGNEPDPNIRHQVATHSNINALAAILKKLEDEFPDKQSRESIKLLVSIIRRPLEREDNVSVVDEDISECIFPDKPHLSISELQAFTTKNKLHQKLLAKLPRSATVNETLSILMQLARYEQTLHTQIRMQQLFRETLSTDITQKTWSILSNGLHGVIREAPPHRLALTIRLAFEPLRRSAHASTLNLLLQTAQLCDAEDTRKLWPHIVNELLMLGSGSDQPSYQKLCHFAARMPPGQMADALPELEGLEAFEKTAIAPDIFPDLPYSCYSLFAFLLKTEIGQYVGDRVIGGLRRYPPDWMIKAVAPLLDLKNNDHELFLYSYLRQVSEQSGLPDPLKLVAGKIIVQALPELPEERRIETWVIGTITALGRLKTRHASALLRQISREKKLLIFPEWPTECRKAASAALSGS